MIKCEYWSARVEYEFEYDQVRVLERSSASTGALEFESSTSTIKCEYWSARVEYEFEYDQVRVLERSSASTGALEFEYERSSARVRGVRSSSEARVRALECSSFTH